MRWNLLLHEWSLIFHTFVLCSWRPSGSSRRRSIWVNIFLVTRNTSPLKTVNTLSVLWTVAVPLKISPGFYARILLLFRRKWSSIMWVIGIIKVPSLMRITSAFTDTTAEKLMHAEKSYSATLNVLPALPVTRLALISSKNGATVSIKLLMSVTDVLKPLITVPLPTSTVTMLSLQTVSTRNVCLRPGLV